MALPQAAVLPLDFSNHLRLGSTSSHSSKHSSHSSTTAQQQQQRYFATCAPGLEPVVAAELCAPAIAASDVKLGSSGVFFTGTLATAFNANLWLRSAIRVLAELSSCRLPPRRRSGKHDPIYEFVRESVDWPTLLAQDEPGQIDDDENENEKDGSGFLSSSLSSPSSSELSHAQARLKGARAVRRSQKIWRFRSFSVQTRAYNCLHVNNSVFASVRAKDAICDAIRDACSGHKPSPSTEGRASADVPLFMSLYNDQATLYRDMSGISLHRRGYRDAMHRASLNEAIAAGVLTIAGWNTGISGFGGFNKEFPENFCLLDPMCGSGTFLIEAALIICNRAPGLMRSHWPFQAWHDFDSTLWKECEKLAAAAKTLPPPGARLLGNDIHEGALSLCMRNARCAEVDDLLDLSCKDCKDYLPPTKPSLVVVNPPWGARLDFNRDDGLEDSWQKLGQLLKQRCNNSDVYILSGNASATRGLRMKNDKRWPITVGGVECKLLHYHVLPPRHTDVLDA